MTGNTLTRGMRRRHHYLFALFAAAMLLAGIAWMLGRPDVLSVPDKSHASGALTQPAQSLRSNVAMPAAPQGEGQSAGNTAGRALPAARGGKQTPGVFRFGNWYLRNASSNGPSENVFNFGRASGDIPIVGDWTGNGYDLPGVVRSSGDGLLWRLKPTNDEGAAITEVLYGQSGDVPIACDWDGDGKDDLGVFRQGTWLLTPDHGVTIRPIGFGQPGDIPVCGDLPGDGRDRVGVFRVDDAGNGTWFFSDDEGYVVAAFGFGARGDIPIVGDWDGDGKDDIGVVRRGSWLLTTDHGQSQYASFGYGNQTGDTPVVGRWPN